MFSDIIPTNDPTKSNGNYNGIAVDTIIDVPFKSALNLILAVIVLVAGVYLTVKFIKSV